MKRLFILFSMICLFLVSANAQKTVVTTRSFSDTQARMLEVTARSYVRPLIVDLNVVGPRSTFKKQYDKTSVEVAMNGNLDNLRSRAIYDAAEYYNCDAIVAATFKIELSEDGAFYNLEMKGFPANFDQDSWHPMEERDFQWIEVDARYGAYNESEGDVIKNKKK